MVISYHISYVLLVATIPLSSFESAKHQTFTVDIPTIKTPYKNKNIMEYNTMDSQEIFETQINNIMYSIIIEENVKP
jgi:hypothetical protein